MLQLVFEQLDRVFHFQEVKAHCDVPCGIYDPHQAQVAALTVIRMIDLATDLAKAGHAPDSLEYQNSLTRYILVKEEHAELCKKEIRVIFGDFIKKEHVEKYPELPTLMHKIMQLGSKARQTTSRETAVELLGAVNRFAEIFWEIKGVPTKKVKAPYKPEEEIVYPIL
jgi:nickel superoxide dismutase